MRRSGPGKRNARRNRWSVVSTADLHPRHCFRSKAPSSKAYDSRRATGLATDLSTSFGRRSGRPSTLSTARPRRLGQSTSSGRTDPPSRTGNPSGSSSNGGASPTRQPVPDRRSTRSAGTGSRAPSPPMTTAGTSLLDPTARDVVRDQAMAARLITESSMRIASSGANGHPVTCRTSTSPRPTWLPWSVPSASGWNVQSPSTRASSRWLKRPSGSVSSSRACRTVAVAAEHLAPATAAPALGDGPGHL